MCMCKGHRIVIPMEGGEIRRISRKSTCTTVYYQKWYGLGESAIPYEEID